MKRSHYVLPLCLAALLVSSQAWAQEPFGIVIFHPMMGGIPPALAWESLHLFEHEVLPKL